MTQSPASPDYRLTPERRAQASAHVLALAETLEDKLPPRHEWNFMTVFYRGKNPECGTSGCAMGVAHLLWPQAELVHFGRKDTPWGAPNLNTIAAHFGMSLRAVEAIFWGGAYEQEPGQVLPKRVARELRLFAANPARYEAALLLRSGAE